MTKTSHMPTTRHRLASASLPKARHDLEERTLITQIDISFDIVILYLYSVCNLWFVYCDLKDPAGSIMQS